MAFQCMAQIVFHFETRGDLLVHLAIEHDVPGLAGGLGVIHGGVGVPKHVVGIFVGDRAGGDADAGGAGDVVLFELVGFAQELREAVRRCARHLQRLLMSSAIMTNSSPPAARRWKSSPSGATESVLRIDLARRSEIATSNSSPTSWPRLSLISLKRSKSAKKRAKFVLGVSLAAFDGLHDPIAQAAPGWAGP